ncbi:MAG: hypothetical protein R6T96_10265, partial [Longimicrobiales bacterium]
PAPQRRQQSWHPHHVLVTRDDLESYELRGALHVGDVLALHAPNAMTRLGHAGEAGAVFVTTRVGAEGASESAILGEASQVAGYSGGRSHEAYLAAGATLGAVAGLGVTSVQYLLQDDGGICTSGCEWEILRVVGSGLLGMGVGELLHRLRGG